MITSAAIGSAISRSTAAQPGRSERPALSSQARHMANTRTPPSVKTQQSPQTGSRQRAHGPAATAPQRTHLAGEPPPSEI